MTEQTQKNVRARESALNALLADYGDCHNASNGLGICKMPPGYALLLNSDESHYFWLRFDGVESVINWDRWAIYRGARDDSKKLVPCCSCGCDCAPYNKIREMSSRCGKYLCQLCNFKENEANRSMNYLCS
jgi:hypothetical protein